MFGIALSVRLVSIVAAIVSGGLGLALLWSQWSSSHTITTLTKERDAALERVGRLTGENDKLVLSIETQNGAFVTYQIRANSLLAASLSALDSATKAGQVLAGVNDTLRSRVLPTAPDAACIAADALILEFVR